MLISDWSSDVCSSDLGRIRWTGSSAATPTGLPARSGGWRVSSRSRLPTRERPAPRAAGWGWPAFQCLEKSLNVPERLIGTLRVLIPRRLSMSDPFGLSKRVAALAGVSPPTAVTHITGAWVPAQGHGAEDP